MIKKLKLRRSEVIVLTNLEDKIIKVISVF